MNHLSSFLLLIHFASTLFMVGLIWFVQVIHYPLMAQVGRDVFPEYERRHVAATTWVVAPPMLIELGTGILLLWIRPPGTTLSGAIAGVGLLAIIWLSTILIQVPAHGRLTERFEDTLHRRLVRGNWIRTLAWSARGVIVGSLLSQVLIL
jgi:hypothetical protein